MGLDGVIYIYVYIIDHDCCSSDLIYSNSYITCNVNVVEPTCLTQEHTVPAPAVGFLALLSKLQS